MRFQSRPELLGIAVLSASTTALADPTPSPSLLPDGRWSTGVSCVAEREANPPGSSANVAIFAARGSTIHVVGSGADRATGSATLDFTSFSVVNRGIGSYSNAMRLSLGASSAGVEGELAVEYLFGLRFPVTPYQGPFLRAGFGGRLFGSGILIQQSTNLPLAEVGYEWSGRIAEWGIAARTSYEIWGGYETGGRATRTLDGSPMAGSAAWMVANPALLRFEWKRVFASDGGSEMPIDLVQASGCELPTFGGLGPITICLDSSVSTGGVFLPGAAHLSRSTALSAGLSLGIGGLTFGPLRLKAAESKTTP